MEGAGHLQGHTAPGSGLFGQGGSLRYGGLLAADHQLSGAVVVGDDHAAKDGRRAAGLLQGLAVQPQYCHHGVGLPRCGLLHCFAPEGHQLRHRLCVQNPGGVEGGVFPQGEPGGGRGDDAPVLQQGGHGDGKGHHTGLRVPGLIQHALLVGEANFLQVKIHPLCRPVKGGAEDGVGVQVGPHAGVLAALPRI